MKQICIISGKGGTGKTVFAASFAALAEKKVMADCDVDAADLYLLLQPVIREKHEFYGGKVAIIDAAKCTQCGRCVEECRYSAIENFQVISAACEGCGVCHLVCEENAVEMKDRLCGQWFVSDTDYGPMVHARLGVAAENSGKLVTQVRQKTKQIAEERQLDLVVIDGPPGIGCPVLASLTGVDLALVITEPTLSGIHDMERIHEVCKKFSIRDAVCVNKFDINPEITGGIESWCRSQSVPLAGRVQFDRKVVESVSAGIPFVEHSNSETAHQIRIIYQNSLKFASGERK